MDGKEMAEWVTGIGTLLVVIVAVFQDWIRQWFWRPRLSALIVSGPPDCKSVPVRMQIQNGLTDLIVDSIYLRMRVANTGNSPALNAEVYADSLWRERADGSWERVTKFPPMNLTWSDISSSNLGNAIYFPRISPGMTKHCDIAAIYDPASLAQVLVDGTARVDAIVGETKLQFCLISQPNHRGHIVGPGRYQLRVFLAAENAKPVLSTIVIKLTGQWMAREEEMLRDGVGISIEH
jgi:hypothetical protein